MARDQMLHNLLKTYRTTSIRCCTTSSINAAPLKALTTDPSPVFASVGTFAPATVPNLGPCFDFLGCAVDGLGDHVTLAVDPHVHPGQISISQITAANDSVGKKLTKNPNFNCAGIAALAVKKMLDIRSVGLSR